MCMVVLLCGGWRSERDGGGEQPGCAAAAGQDAGELDRVEVELRAGLAGAERAAGGSGEGERERLAVPAGPVGDHVGEDPAVVAGGQDGLSTGGAADVNAVHPRI